MEPPSKLKTAAVVQLVSGLVDLTIGWWISSMVIGCAGSVVSLPCGGFCGLCGMLGMLIIPIGLMEIIAGVLGMTNPKTAGTIMKITSVLQIAGLLAGGLTGFVAGIVVLLSMQDAEVRAYLETSPTDLTPRF